jgi:hypothetical protein
MPVLHVSEPVHVEPEQQDSPRAPHGGAASDPESPPEPEPLPVPLLDAVPELLPELPDEPPEEPPLEDDAVLSVPPSLAGLPLFELEQPGASVAPITSAPSPATIHFIEATSSRPLHCEQHTSPVGQLLLLLQQA